MPIRFLLTLVIGSAALPSAMSEEVSKNLRLTLPTEMYAVVGVELSVYFDNVVLTETPEAFGFSVKCGVGQTETRRWRLTATPQDVGSHELTVIVSDGDGKELTQKSTRLTIIPACAGTDRKVRLLIVGDSLTHATAYPNEVARLLNREGNPVWQMLGTHRPASAVEGVTHEGYGGWTWQRFASHYEPNPDGTYRKRSSPFVFLDKSGIPTLNVARYLDESLDGLRPDIVFFLLGINDCFSANPDDPAAIDARIDSMLEQADLLLAEFHKAAPKADLAVCVTTPPNARESGFEANYKGRYHRWGWKRIQHRLVERLLTRFDDPSAGRDSQSKYVYIVPTQLNIDPLNGYPENNGVHPNGAGYQQIGVSIYSWLKWRMHQQ